MPTTGTTLHVRGPGQKFAGDSVLEVMVCPVCGVIYAAPEALIEWSRQAPHRNFYCPNGDQLHFPGKTEAQKLQERLEAEQNRRALVQSRLDQEQARSRALKGVVTKTKKRLSATEQRLAAGVCPCCNRTFKQLSRHMQSKHPEFEPTPAA